MGKEGVRGGLLGWEPSLTPDSGVGAVIALGLLRHPANVWDLRTAPSTLLGGPAGVLCSQVRGKSVCWPCVLNVGLGEVAEELLELSSVVGEGHMGWKVLLPGVVWRETGCQQRPL